MRIEAGKYYRIRDGRKVGPIERSSRGYANKPYPFQSPQLKFISDDGMVNSGTSFDPQSDLIAEWTETPLSPVRTKTVKEIVPGVYGTINIENVYGDGVNIYANPGKWSASDLRAAVLVLTQLAEALEE